MLRNCLPQNVRRVLTELPASLDETYERMLREILKANPDQAHRLLQCLTVATRPLSVDELAEVLALDFGAKDGIPVLNKDWLWDDEQHGVLSTCSSLIVVVEGYVDDSKTRVVQFAHFSVKEFLTSDRLATLKTDISRFHIRLEPAHTVLTQACLANLLHSDCNYEAKNRAPLSGYAARHWVDHAQFKNVSLCVEDGMRRLFDPAKPYFTAWLNLYNLDHGWGAFTCGYSEARFPYLPLTLTSLGEADAPLCLYYAALCGFRDLTKHLIAEYPQHLNAEVGRNRSPLAAASHNRHIQVAKLLHQHGAVLPTGYSGYTLLHAASSDGSMNVVQWLLDIGADVNVQGDDHKTPLHLAAANGRLEVVQTLLGHSVDVNDAAAWGKYTPLHEASLGGHLDVVRLLIQNGADASTDLQKLFLLASKSKSAETVQFFIQLGADVNARDERYLTPLHLASFVGSDDTVRILIEHGADVNTRDESHRTPLHVASSQGHDDVVQLLIELGADVHARDQNESTNLHMVSSSKDFPWLYSATTLCSCARLLIEHGANVNAYDRNHKTPLHLAVSFSDDFDDPNADFLRLLLENGAHVDVEDDNGLTPFQIATSEGYHEIAQLLIDHGASVE